MEIIDTEIRDVKILKPRVFGDERGFFMETWRDSFFRENVADRTFVQDNHSKSTAHVLRGLHYQLNRPQGKLVRVVQGEVFDVAVDIRKSSPTFGKYVGVRLSSENKLQLFVYKCTNYYDPSSEHSIKWNDPEIGIEWPIPAGVEPLLSKKDLAGVPFKDAVYFD